MFQKVRFNSGKPSSRLHSFCSLQSTTQECGKHTKHRLYAVLFNIFTWNSGQTHKSRQSLFPARTESCFVSISVSWCLFNQQKTMWHHTIFIHYLVESLLTQQLFPKNLNNCQCLQFCLETHLHHSTSFQTHFRLLYRNTSVMISLKKNPYDLYRNIKRRLTLIVFLLHVP